MPTVTQIAQAIDEIAPFHTAEEWDNSGTLVDCGGEVSHVLVALDITDEVVNEAQATACQLVVAHHPVIFHPLKRVAYGDGIYRLIKKGISAICAHTNLDGATGGVNDILAAIFGLAETEIFAGIGRIGKLPEEVSAAQLAQLCVKKFGAHVRLADAGRGIQRLAVLGGSGGGLLEEAVKSGADCIFTGEADHHDALDAKAAGVSLIAAGHFSSEFPVLPVLAGWLGRHFPDMKATVSRRGKDPFVYLEPPK